MEEEDKTIPGTEPLSEDIRKIVGGVATLVLILVPILLIRKIVRTIEESDKFKTLQNTLM